LIPYGKQKIDEADIAAVVEVLRSDWLTTGPKVEEFEHRFAEYVGARHAVAVSSGTAALHAALHALGVGPGDEVIVPPITFAATANAAVFLGATPVFADVDPQTLLIDPGCVEKKISPRTRAIIGVDYGGQPCDYDSLTSIATRAGANLVADACHSLGATLGSRQAGSLAELSAFSFHPVKHITTGEGGMITTGDARLAGRMRQFRNHGITTDHHQRHVEGAWFYEMVELGYNYRLTDFQCALGLSQLSRLPDWLLRRREIALCYSEAFRELEGIELLQVRPGVSHAYHLYVVRITGKNPRANRDRVFSQLRGRGIGVNVHYIPVHLHPFYRTRFGTGPGLCPVAERVYGEILSLPLFPAMTDEDVAAVVREVERALTND
jgi:perosamine synthetase